jgi:D-alanyl-D-alanine carboxypeptidase/D-alanyl-D-alanine-endopeptidase (penicillin-binding protein 4)
MSSVRRTGLLLGALVALLVAAPGASARTALQRVFDRQMAPAGAGSGALAVDLDTGETLYSLRSSTGRMPASVEKLWTTSTALLRLGRDHTFDTTVRAAAQPDELGVLHGNLYLVGGGDPTLGAAGIRRLAAQVSLAGVQSVTGRVVGDESRFDALRGVPSSNYGWSTDVEPLSALSYTRNDTRYGYVPHPASRAATALTAALQHRHIAVADRARRGRAPADSSRLAVVHSPPLAKFITLTNQPSDNFYAETLIKDLGAELGNGGTTAAGATVVRRQARRMDLRPRIHDRSGLSRADRSTPRQVVSLLERMETHPAFRTSLALTGRSGTVEDRMRSGPAAGACRVKTGTLHDASNLAGYCTTAAGHHVVFAILMNFVYPGAAHGLQDTMVQALARYG